jgi:choice-of-anchor C domain-containing protein
LTDGEEVLTYGTNPTLVDTDNDGLTDAQETMDLDPAMDGVQNPFVPWDPDALGDNGQPWGDGRLDGWNDWDGDGVSNRQEFIDGTNPLDGTSFTEHLTTSYTLGTPTRLVTGLPGQFFSHLKWSHGIYENASSYQLAYVDQPNQQYFTVPADGSAAPVQAPVSMSLIGNAFPSFWDYTWAYGDASWWRSDMTGQYFNPSVASLVEQRLDGSGTTQQYFDWQGTVYFPDFSPVGPLAQRYVAYMRLNPSIGFEENVVAVPVAEDGTLSSSAPRIQLSNLSMPNNTFPSGMRWSEDAERIAFQYDTFNNGVTLPVEGIYVLRDTLPILRGEATPPTSLSDERFVPIDSGSVGYPSFTADGEAVFFTKDTTQSFSGELRSSSQFDSSEFEIAYASADGGPVRSIPLPGDQIYANVSPDGTKIAYADNSSGTWDIYVADLLPMNDADHDGLSDEEEVTLGSDPNDPDTDDDGLNDFQEVRTYATNPLLPDSDGDGLSDNEEVRDLDPATPGVQNPFNPLDPDSTGNNGAVGPDGVLDGANDWDNDGASNADEFAAGTNPLTSDNRSPVLVPVGAQAVNEGQLLQITVVAADPDGNPVGLWATGLPTDAVFIDNGDATGTFTWTPGYDASAGSPYSATFFASDGVLTVEETIEITVLNTNRAPEMSVIGDLSIDEGSTNSVMLTATDPDANGVVLSASNLPPFAVFFDHGNGTGTLSMNPGYGDANVYAGVTITATDDDAASLNASQTFQVTVNNVPNPPNAPVVNGTTPTDDNTPTWTWTTGGGGGGGMFRYRLDSNDGPWTELSATDYTPVTPLPGGLHELEVQEQSAIDANDWSASGRFTIVVEAIPGASRVWGCTFGPHSEIFQLDTATGAVIAYQDFGNLNFADVAVDPSDTFLYAVHLGTGYNQLSKIDTATLTVRQTWTLPSEVSINALTWKAGTADTLYGIQEGGADSSILYELTLGATGPSVRTVGLIPVGGSGGDLAEDPATGQWWAAFMEDDTASLVSVDTLKPEASVFGPTLDRAYVDALEYDGNGTLWAASSATIAGATYGTREVYRIQINGGNTVITPVCDLSAALQGDGISGLARSQSIVLNGSFETGTDPGNYTKLATGSTAITNWAVLPNGAYYIGPYYQAAAGTRSVKLTTHLMGAVAQTLKTVPGRSYMLTFAMAGDPFQNLTPAQKIKELTVTVAGQSEDFRFDVTGRSLANMGWEGRSWRFTATAAETQLKFATKTAAPYGPCIDNVAVVPIQGEVLWGVTNGLGDAGFGSGGQIFTFDTATGQIEVKASYGPPLQAFGDIAVRDNGDIYVTYQDSADGFDKLARVNPTTWAFDWTQDLGGAEPDVNGVGQVNALEFIDGKLLGVTAGPVANLLQFKPNGSGALVSNLGNLGAYSEGDLAQNLLGTVSYTDRVGTYSSLETLLFGPPLSLTGRLLDFAQVSGLAYDRYGVLWAARSVDQALYTVNQCYPALTPAYDLGGALGGAIEGLSRPGFYEQTVDLMNGSFESGTDPLAATKLAAGSTALTGWTVGGYGVYYVGTYYQAGEGARCIKLTQQRPGWIQQTIETEVGQTYEVNFKMAGDPYPYLTPEQKIKVAEASTWDGTTLLESQQFTFDTTGRNVSNMGWANRTWRFTATSTQTTLRFTSISPGPYGPCVDDITIRKAN